MMFFFFFKQKTAYEMRISDWSSDVCSSDLRLDHQGQDAAVDDRDDRGETEERQHAPRPQRGRIGQGRLAEFGRANGDVGLGIQIGRASGRERVCQYV